MQAQTVLVKVRIFQDHDDSDGQGRDLESLTTVFAGHLLLSDGRLVVGDVVGESRFTISLLGMPGRRRVRVSVDDAQGRARAVDIVISAETV
ncbi:hypothetical protein ACF087_36155 [Streptomyces goshikiensis]|uniref:hypothetical protein n=1 Tax=Streptomyces goshikiensis TaxID=1942 RepID=UPI0036F5F023